tara:strand:- start:573 stop:770 length:198 start_codon:yes stop_codon:yes gene_type:complete
MRFFTLSIIKKVYLDNQESRNILVVPVQDNYECEYPLFNEYSLAEKYRKEHAIADNLKIVSLNSY